MDIRQLVADDIGIYQDCRLSALAESPASFSSSFEEESSFSDDRILSRLTVAEGQMVLGWFDDDVLAGTIGIGRSRGNKTQHKCFIWGLYVCPGYRRKGIAKTLLSEAIDRVRGIESILVLQISVVEENDAAMSLYRAIGFKEYGREPTALVIDGRSYDEILLSMDVSVGARELSS